MTTRERLLTLGLLTALTLSGLALLRVPTGPTATAAAPATIDELGPATALHLTDDAGALVVRNRHGRLSWGEGELRSVHSVAYVYIGGLLGQLLDAETYARERDDTQARLRSEEEALQQKEEQFRAEFGSIGRDDPRFPEAQEKYQALLAEREQWQRASVQQLGELAAGQIERAFRDLLAAVNVVADRKGIDIVYRTVPPDDPFNATNPDQARLAVQLRSVLRYPDSLDITPDVRQELALEEE